MIAVGWDETKWNPGIEVTKPNNGKTFRNASIPKNEI